MELWLFSEGKSLIDVYCSFKWFIVQRTRMLIVWLSWNKARGEKDALRFVEIASKQPALIRPMPMIFVHKFDGNANPPTNVCLCLINVLIDLENIESTSSACLWDDDFVETMLECSSDYLHLTFGWDGFSDGLGFITAMSWKWRRFNVSFKHLIAQPIKHLRHNWRISFKGTICITKFRRERERWTETNHPRFNACADKKANSNQRFLETFNL